MHDDDLLSGRLANNLEPVIYQDKDKNWQTSTHWKAGEGFIWDSEHLHLSANAGLHPKFTLQVSGFLV